MSDQAESLRDMAAGARSMLQPAVPGALGRGPRIIAVTSGKGGVGKTSIVLNLSIALAADRQRVVVLDADLGLGNVDVMLGIVPRYTLAHVAAGEIGLSDAELSGPGGIKIVPCGSGVESLIRLPEADRGVLVDALESIERQAEFIVLDTGAGLSGGVIGFLAAAHEVVVVTTPEPTSITDAYATIKVTSSENPAATVMLIVNMSRDEREAKEAAEKISLVAKKFLSTKVRFLGFVPRDPLVSKAVMRQEPFVLRYPSSPAARAVTDIAKRLRDRIDARPTSGARLGLGLVEFVDRFAARRSQAPGTRQGK